MDNPVGWFEIYVNDLPRAHKFYEAVLGQKLERMDSPDADVEMVTFPMDMNGKGAAGALAKMKGGPAGGGGTIVYFKCTDCGVEAGRVEKAGGKVMKGKMAIGQYGFMALAVDPDGNVFGLHSMT